MLQSVLIAYSLGVVGGVYGQLAALKPTVLFLVALTIAYLLAYSVARWKPSAAFFSSFSSFPSSRFCLVLVCVMACNMGYLRHLVWAYSAISAQLPSEFEGIDMLVSGRVSGLPRATDFGIQYEFQVTGSDLGFTGKVLLNDYEVDRTGNDDSTRYIETIVNKEIGVNSQVEDGSDGSGGPNPTQKPETAISPGQQREMIVRLDRPHGVANPGSFDREGSLLRRGINATGYVRSTIKINPPQRQSLQGVRKALFERMKIYTGTSSVGGLVEALVLGESGRVSNYQNELFSRTGTSHLFVISGLHIGLVAGVAYWLASAFLGFFPNIFLVLPRQKTAKLLAMVAAIGYSALAGFTLPTVRALVMLCAVLVSHLFNRKLSVALRLTLALAVVLTLDPLAPISPGFWFSFIGVAALLLRIEVTRAWANEENRGTAFMGWVQSQLSVFVALFLPLLILGFPISLLSPLINLIVIPILGFLLVPLCLVFAGLAAASAPGADQAFSLVSSILTCLIQGLEWVANSELGRWSQLDIDAYPLTFSTLLGAFLAAALLLYPIFGRTRLLAAPLLFPLIWPAQEAASSPLTVDVVDVGQGLAVIVRTASHVLVYDTGAGREGGFSSGKAMVAPVLRSKGIKRLDMVVISHGDTDHAGGLDGLLAVTPTKLIVTSEIDRPQSVSCHGFGDWVWDEVLFSFMPNQSLAESRNNRSCVLKISFDGNGVLLPGDIEKATELDLVTNFANTLESSLLIAPHHGSKTSSSYPFLKTVRPEQAVFSAAYNNRFGHPADEIQQRYKQMGIATFTTAESGMLSFELRPVQANPFDSEYKFSTAKEYRQAQKRYWRCLRTCR